jgi:hypothetical protein
MSKNMKEKEKPKGDKNGKQQQKKKMTPAEEEEERKRQIDEQICIKDSRSTFSLWFSFNKSPVFLEIPSDFMFISKT